MLRIIQKRKIWFTISGLVVASSVIFLILWGLKFGIDFTGGSLLEVRFTGQRPELSEVRDSLNDLELGSLIVQPAEEHDMILRFQNTEEEMHQTVLERLRGLAVPEEEVSDSGVTIEAEGTATAEIVPLTDEDETQGFEELRYDSVGPSIGAELKSKSLYAITIVLIMMVAYIAWAFRKVSKPVASWKYGIAAIIALFHDVLIVLGIFAYLGHFNNIEVNTAFVAAILTVLGYSVNDTIIVFDRVRENLPRSEEDFEGTVNISVNQTLTRSINTSFTTLLVLLSILFFGGSTIKDFVLALSIGIFIGTYSSIFIASPILVTWEKLKK